MGVKNLAEAEKWVRYRAPRPGYYWLNELLEEYDRRGEAIEQLQEALKQAYAENAEAYLVGAAVERELTEEVKTERDAAVERAKDLSAGLRAMARRSVEFRHAVRHEEELHMHTDFVYDTALAKEMTAATLYRVALVALLDLQERLKDGVIPDEEYDKVLAQARAALAGG
jgi:hypothetical protein